MTSALPATDLAVAPRGGRYLALSGGVGGAKLVQGLDAVLGGSTPGAGRLAAVVNTGDDFEHLGLTISPDIDSVLYALAGLNDRERGWGRANETWACLETVRQLGGPAWFQLGDRDLALHLVRSQMLREGLTATEATGRLCRALGIGATVLPMSDDPVRTIVETADGDLAFQDYFVARRCEPVVTGFRFEGAARARPNPAAMAALADPALAGVIICPSNPFVSVDPILALPGFRDVLAACRAPVIAVSPFIEGRAVKGPAGKMFRELGLDPSPAAVARHYAGLLDGFVVDARDAATEATVPTTLCDTLMAGPEDNARVAAHCLAFIETLRGKPGRAAG